MSEPKDARAAQDVTGRPEPFSDADWDAYERTPPTSDQPVTPPPDALRTQRIIEWAIEDIGMNRPVRVGIRFSIIAFLQDAALRAQGVVQSPELDVERLALALDAPGVFEDPLDPEEAAGLATDIIREYEALRDAV